MAAAVWCKTIIVHYHHIAAVTVAVSQLSRTHGGSESLKWVAIRWEATSPAVVQQRTRHFEVMVPRHSSRNALAQWTTQSRRLIDHFGISTYGDFKSAGRFVERLLAEKVLFLIVDQSIIYGVSTNVDTAYSSKSGDGLLVHQGLGYVVLV
ncbi:hypothetical protein Tco_1104680 [Tanacetum coccineum]